MKKAAMKLQVPTIDTSSAIIFVAGDTTTHEVVRDVWTKVYEAGQNCKEKLDTILHTYCPLYEHATPEFLTLDATIDGELVAMTLLLSARAYGYDAHPWSGYDFKTNFHTSGLEL